MGDGEEGGEGVLKIIRFFLLRKNFLSRNLERKKNTEALAGFVTMLVLIESYSGLRLLLLLLCHFGIF